MLNNQCIIKRNFDKAFIRKEQDGRFLVIPEGLSANEALVFNVVGSEIMKLIDDRKTPRDIKNILVKKYKNVAIHKLFADIDSFLRKMHYMQLIDIEEDDQLRKPNIIYSNCEFTILRCQETDFQMIYELLQKQANECIDSFTVREDVVTPLGLRAKLFNFIEEFYILMESGIPIGLVSILSGKGINSRVSVLSRVKMFSEFSEEQIKKMLTACIDNYVNEIEKECKKIRMVILSDSENAQAQLMETVKQIGFVKVAVLENEYSDGVDELIYDYSA